MTSNLSAQQRLNIQRQTIQECIALARDITIVDYNDVIKSKILNAKYLNSEEQQLLAIICLFQHEERIAHIDKYDSNVQYMIQLLRRYCRRAKNHTLKHSVNFYIDKLVRLHIKKYAIRMKVGRPIGSGKRIYIYDGRLFRTIQECADTYHISKQAMFKRMKRLHII